MLKLKNFWRVVIPIILGHLLIPFQVFPQKFYYPQPGKEWKVLSPKEFGMYDWSDRPPQEGGIDEWRSRELKEPGTYFKYNDVRVNVLSYSLLQIWRKPLP